MKLKAWQVAVLILPLGLMVGFLVLVAAIQIHAWHLNWLWVVIGLGLIAWRWLLAIWTRPQVDTGPGVDLIPGDYPPQDHDERVALAKVELIKILEAAKDDPPLWEDWDCFWQRCRQVVVAIAGVYHPEVKYPLLNIYVPDAYQLLRGTVDEVDSWMTTLKPVLGQVTISQAMQGYDLYRQWQPSARQLWQAWEWLQWLVNPAAAVARLLSQPSSNLAQQQLIGNLNTLLRETTLRHLYHQAMELYGGELATNELRVTTVKSTRAVPSSTLEAILNQAKPLEEVRQQPVNLLLVGRTGAGKSSLINTLFETDQAVVDILPSTTGLCRYSWSADHEISLNLWDSPGYEQVNHQDYRQVLLAQLEQIDLLLLVTPALDPALQMDLDLLREMRQVVPNLPTLGIVTQVDRLRPLREWQPPYDWQWGDRAKEVAIREAVSYRQTQLAEVCDRILPLVTVNRHHQRQAWNTEALASGLVELVGPGQELRVARFLRDRQTKVAAATRIIHRYQLQMGTTQGLASFLKSPILQFLATLTTGTPTLAYLLAEQIPLEQLPTVIGKLQLAVDLHKVIAPADVNLDLLALWPLILEHNHEPAAAAWAFGHSLVEYWTQDLTVDQLKSRTSDYLKTYQPN